MDSLASRTAEEPNHKNFAARCRYIVEQARTKCTDILLQDIQDKWWPLIEKTCISRSYRCNMSFEGSLEINENTYSKEEAASALKKFLEEKGLTVDITNIKDNKCYLTISWELVECDTQTETFNL
jgi:hypothetical protein